MHAATVDSKDRFGHEGRMETILLGDGFYRQFKGHNIIGSAQRIAVLEVDFMLTAGYLMMARFHFITHALQHHADLTACRSAMVQRVQIEVAGVITGLCGGLSVFIGFKQEEFTFRTDIEGIALFLRLLQDALQGAARVSRKRSSVRQIHVADQTCNFCMLRPPGEHRIGIKIRIQIHIGFIDPHKAFDRASVDHDLVVYCLFYLRCGDRDILQTPEDVGKLHADEFNVAFSY